MDLTRTLFADCDPSVRAGFLSIMSAMDLLEGIATIALPTTVLIGSRDRLTPPARSQTDGRRHSRGAPGHPGGPGAHAAPRRSRAVTDEIIRAVKG